MTLDATATRAAPAGSTTGRGFDMLRNVDVVLTVELGRTRMRLKDAMALAEGSVVPLNKLTDEALDVLVNGHRIATARVVTEEGRFALEIVAMDAEADAETEGAAQRDAEGGS